jgi:hypothetical protein
MWGAVARHGKTVGAAAAASLVGVGAFNATTSMDPKRSTAVASCESPTVVGLLQEIAQGVSRMETTLGGLKKSSVSSSTNTSGVPSNKNGNGIDVVLGAQWGDEGKGKLVDMLSQVRAVSYVFDS